MKKLNVEDMQKNVNKRPVESFAKGALNQLSERFRIFHLNSVYVCMFIHIIYIYIYTPI